MSTWAFSDSAAPGSRRRVASEGEDAASTLPTPPSAARHVATASSLAAASRFQHSTRMTPLNRHGHLGANLAAALVDGNMAAAVQGHHRSTTQQTSYRSPSSDSSRQSYGTPSTTSHPSTDFSPRRQPDGGGTRRRSLPTDNMFGIEGLTVNFSGYDFSGNSAEVQGQSFFQGDPAIAAALDEFGDFLAQENILRGGQGGAQSALFGAMNHVDGGELSQLGQSVPLGNHQFLVPDQSQAPSAQSTLKRKAPATSEAWRSHFQAAANSSPYDPRPATAPLPSTKPLPSPASPGLGEWHSGYASDVSSSAYSPMLPAGSPFFPPMVRSPLAPQAIDPMSLVYPERLPVFPYMASNEVLAEARMPDIMPDDDPGGRFKRAGGVPRKRVSWNSASSLPFRCSWV